jgi:hypothetical protein
MLRVEMHGVAFPVSASMCVGLAPSFCAAAAVAFCVVVVASASRAGPVASVFSETFQSPSCSSDMASLF